MGFVYLILSLILLLVLKVFTQALNLRFLFNLDANGASARILYLYPFVNISVELKKDKPFLTFYIFKLRIFRKELKMNRKKGNRALLRAADAKDIRIRVSYGFRDPFITGLVCGALNMAEGFLKTARFSQYPDFVPPEEYVYLDGTANIHLGHTIANYVKNKNK